MDIRVVKDCPYVSDYIRLRAAAGLSPRDEQGARTGLANTWYGIHIMNGETAVGMGRIVGDGGTAFQIVDIAVLPEYQGQGLGKVIMDNLMNYYKEHAPVSAYLSLIADGDAKYLYQKYGFKEVAPVSIGMSFKSER